MLINLWSTPRTGSVWQSFKLRQEYSRPEKPSVLISEIFNIWHMSMYSRVENGVLKNVYKYQPGDFYARYSLDDLGIPRRENVYEQRTLSVAEEEIARRNLLQTYNKEACTLILHNHTSPLPDGVYQSLRDQGHRNIYIGRKSIVGQLSSYGVAIATREFVRFKESVLPLGVDDWNLRPDHKSLEQLTERVLHWHSLVDPQRDEILWYEDIDFSRSFLGAPLKQNRVDPKLRLCEDARFYIQDCEDHYRNRLYEITMERAGNANQTHS